MIVEVEVVVTAPDDDTAHTVARGLVASGNVGSVRGSRIHLRDDDKEVV
jgi:hypothetical protein